MDQRRWIIVLTGALLAMTSCPSRRPVRTTPPLEAAHPCSQKGMRQRIVALVSKQPGKLSELEGILGKIHRWYRPGARFHEHRSLVRKPFSPEIPHLDMVFRFDWHHGEPFKRLDPHLEQYTIQLRVCYRYTQAQLRQRVGPAVSITLMESRANGRWKSRRQYRWG